MDSMFKILPMPKVWDLDQEASYTFTEINLDFNGCSPDLMDKIKDIALLKLGPLGLKIGEGQKVLGNTLALEFISSLDTGRIEGRHQHLFEQQGYILKSEHNKMQLYFAHLRGAVYGLSTLKQIMMKQEGPWTMPHFYILDYPEVGQRALATTFAWYAGYGRVGFDMQLWDFEDWKAFLNQCSDFKINQLNMCMYGYWPFEFEQYPETTLKDFPLKIWNDESKNWIEIRYTHPNIVKEFLPELIDYAHRLGIDIFAYIGLNSYNGGYSNIHRDKRMKLPAQSKYINDFDTLCLSQKDTIAYLKASIGKVASLGFDGIIFEESEEAFWYCNCDRCKAKYIDKTSSPAEAKHMANYELLKILHGKIKEVNPGCEVGLRAWREPPLKKDLDYLKKCEASIPKDVSLYWAPGLYVGEEEFEKWVSVFGTNRICARDTESNAISSCLGRLYRVFRSNILRPEEETNQQHIDNDIRQHKGSARVGARGINGYMFEYYSYFMHFLVHAGYGWDSSMEADSFFEYAAEAVFGLELAPDIMYVLKNMLTIHESQISIFTSEFPFQRNKVEARDIDTIKQALGQWPIILEKIQKVKKELQDHKYLQHYYQHFDKIENAHRRNKYIYKLCLNAISYDQARDGEEKVKYLKQVYRYNEKDFDLARKKFFDVNPVDATGIKASMFPYHEIKRVIRNQIEDGYRDQEQIYLGVEALGWLWL